MENLSQKKESAIKDFEDFLRQNFHLTYSNLSRKISYLDFFQRLNENLIDPCSDTEKAR